MWLESPVSVHFAERSFSTSKTFDSIYFIKIWSICISYIDTLLRAMLKLILLGACFKTLIRKLVEIECNAFSRVNDICRGVIRVDEVIGIWFVGGKKKETINFDFVL